MALRILQYNILDGFGHQEDCINRFAAELHRSTFDVLSLNEYRPGRLDELLPTLGYTHRAVDDQPPNPNRAAVFSRHPFDTRPGLESIRALWCRFGRLDFVNYHATPAGVEAVLGEIDLLTRTLQGDELILAGDHNSLSPRDVAALGYHHLAASPHLRRYQHQGELSYEAVQALEHVGFVDTSTDSDRATVPTELGRAAEGGQRLRLDFAFARTKRHRVQSRILRGEPWNTLSDHYPLMIEVEEDAAA